MLLAVLASAWVSSTGGGGVVSHYASKVAADEACALATGGTAHPDGTAVLNTLTWTLTEMPIIGRPADWIRWFCVCPHKLVSSGPGSVQDFDFGKWGAMKGYDLFPADCLTCGCNPGLKVVSPSPRLPVSRLSASPIATPHPVGHAGRPEC